MTPPTALLTADPAVELHACLDRLADSSPDQLGDEELAERIRLMTQAEARLAGIRLSCVAQADRSRAAARAGAASTGQWVAKLANSDQVDAHRQVGLAQGLGSRHATRQALASGTISPDHAAVIVRADRDLPQQVTAEQRDQVEADLVTKARTMPPGLLRKAARRALAAVEADTAVVDAHEDALVAGEEDRARSRTRLTLHDNNDGTVTGHFTVPVLHGQLLRKILQTITAPRRGRPGASEAQVGPREARTDWDRARGDALCELIEHLPTDHLHPKTAATVVVRIDEPALREALKVAGLDTGADLSAGQARRLACNAGLIPAVFGGKSLPLDLGRSARLFNETQRVAVGLAHPTCVADGCERPFSWCELHHRDPWSRGGATNLADAITLCHFHHQRIHDRDYDHHRLPDGSIRFHEIREVRRVRGISAPSSTTVSVPTSRHRHRAS